MILAQPRRLWALFLVVFVLPLGLRSLIIPDEGRYAEIAREMVQRGDWVVPHLLGMHYFEKPVGGYWFNALSQMLLGSTDFASRLPTALATGISALLVGALAQRLWADRRTTALAVFIYLSFGLVAPLGMYITLDAQLTAWLNLSLLAFHGAVTAQRQRARVVAWLVLGVACGMGFLTKGFVAWLLPVLVAGPYMFWQRRLPELLRYGPLAVLAALVVAAPWALAVHRSAPDFWNFFFWNEHVRRFAAQDAQHTQPAWFYVPVLVLGCLPWLGLAVPALRDAWSQRREPRVGLLLIWLVAPLLFFSVARGKLPAYILLCFTPAALLLARALAGELEGGRTSWLKVNAWINLGVAVVLLAVLVFARRRGIYGPEDARAWAVGMGLGAGFVLLALAQWRWPLRAWELAAIPQWAALACLPLLFPQELASSKAPSVFIRQHLDALSHAQSVLCNDPGLCALVAWDLQRDDPTVYQSAGELQYGLATPAGAGRLVSMAEVGAWIAQARTRGSVAAILRVNRADDEDLAPLPQGASLRALNHRLLVLVYPALPAQ